METIGIVANTDKAQALEAATELVRWLEQRGIRPQLNAEAAQQLGRQDLGTRGEADYANCKMLIVLGGDGTLLRAARIMAPLGVPVLGVNTGHLGFLTELEASELFDHLEPVLAGKCSVDERLMLEARVFRQGHELKRFLALNDVVIARGPRARMVQLEIEVGSTLAAAYPADGVIMATPTGSTAYSLSAGGPIVTPSLDVVLITPICPHTTANTRPLVVSPDEGVTVHVGERRGDVMLTVDGQWGYTLRSGDVVTVKRGPVVARLVRLPGYRFYSILRRKLATPLEAQ